MGAAAIQRSTLAARHGAAAAWLTALALAAASPPAQALDAYPPHSPGERPSVIAAPARADFGDQAPSEAARRVANWVVTSRDNHGLPFAVLDKTQARVFVFGADARLRGASPVLLGRAKGDDSVPGIGARRLHSIRPEERTTPAGRFDAFPGRDFEHDVLWIDYDAGISMHRVVHGDPGDRRLERLASPSPRERRISYGCVNVPAAFYDAVVVPTLGAGASVVYILPEVKSLAEVFGISDGGLAQR